MKVSLKRGVASVLGRICLWGLLLFACICIASYAVSRLRIYSLAGVNDSPAPLFDGKPHRVTVVEPNMLPAYTLEKVFPSTVLVVNGAGYIGFHLATHLQSLGHNVTVVDTLSSKSTHEKDLKISRQTELIAKGINSFRGEACHSYFLGHILNTRVITHVVFAPPSASSQLDFTDILVCFSNIAQTLSNHRRSIRLVYGVAGSTMKQLTSNEKDTLFAKTNLEYVISHSHHNLNKALGESMASIARLYQNLHQLPVAGVSLPEVIGDHAGPGSLFYHIYKHMREGTALYGYGETIISTVSMEQCVEAFVHLVQVRYHSHVLVTIAEKDTTVMSLKSIVDAMHKNYEAHFASSNISPPRNKMLIVPPKRTGEGDGTINKQTERHAHGLRMGYSYPKGTSSGNLLTLDIKQLTTKDFSMYLMEIMTSLEHGFSVQEKARAAVKKMVDSQNIAFDKLEWSTQEGISTSVEQWFNRGGGAGKSVIFSCYFNKKVDPQRGRFLADDNFKYIEKWYNSVVANDLYAVIFHDGLSKEFLRKYSTNKITFQLVALGERSTNDERFFFYYKYLCEHPEITAVTMTDISDVVFQRDPFEFMMLTGDYLYAGRDYGNRMEDNGWLTPREKVCFVKGFDKEEHRLIEKKTQVYNAGVVGGYTDTIIEFLVGLALLSEWAEDNSPVLAAYSRRTLRTKPNPNPALYITKSGISDEEDYARTIKMSVNVSCAWNLLYLAMGYEKSDR
eukprot:CFRG7653T1